MNHPSPLRPVLLELERRGVCGIVASTHVLFIVGDLTRWRVGGLEYHFYWQRRWRVGGLEYHFYWQRLHDGFADRLVSGRRILRVNDLNYTWPPSEDFGLRLRALAQRHPGHIRCSWRDNPYEIWEADVPLREILAQDPAPSLVSSDRRR